MPDLAQRLTRLRQAWQGRAQFTLLMSRFGDGQDFEALRALWREDPLRPAKLCVFSAAQNALPPPWPAPTRNFHLLDFESGQLRLLLSQGHAPPWRLPRQLQSDLLWIDGRDMPYPAACARLSAPEACLVLAHASAAQTEALRRSGFVADAQADEWRYRPHPRQRRQLQAVVTAPAKGKAIVIGAGIAGACAAAALARKGWQCTVLDASGQPAAGASGNPAALFHGTVHAGDGPHARFTRAGALHAQRVFSALMARGVPGTAQGLVRAGTAAHHTALPAAWVEHWGGESLNKRGSGLRPAFTDSAWFFPGGGWVDAAAAVRALLDTQGVQFQGQSTAASLCRAGETWHVLDAAGRSLAHADVVVLALADTGGSAVSDTPDASALLNSAGAINWPPARSRGQVTTLQPAGDPLPWPVAGGGYAVSLGAGSLLCGATSQVGDTDWAVRESDHAFNLQRLQAQTGIVPQAGTEVHGRVGWRERAPDGLPVVGAAMAWPLESTAESPRLAHIARVPGLFVLGALAGRGFTWGPLAGEVLASLIAGDPVPLEGDLLDALDPARFWLRGLRATSEPPSSA